MERCDFRFSRRDVRAATGWGDTQLKLHLHRLEELEYLLVHRGGRGQSFVYELLFDRQGADGRPWLPGLIDVEKLRTCNYDGNRSALEAEKSGASRPQVGGMSGDGRSEPTPITAGLENGFYEIPPKLTDTAESVSAVRVRVGAGR